MSSLEGGHPLPHTTVLSFVIPCLNEAATIGSVIEDCLKGGESANISYEIIVADNGSTDGSQEIAQAAGAHVVEVPIRGYGAALLAGIRAAKGTYILMGDADSTYEFSQADRFLGMLQQGYDLVMGNRFKGRIAPSAMPFLHRYLGNPVLSALGRLFFGIKIGDFHCGLRGFDRDAILALNLHCTGMEFASEMVIKSSLMDLRTAEIPTNLRPNPPGRIPHLKTWRDGWRHLKFMLSFAPKYSLLPMAGLLFIVAIFLVTLYSRQWGPFTGPNTLVFATSCFVAVLSILSDYLLTREMLYSSYRARKSKASFWLDGVLGLMKGTDRLFKLAAFAFAASLLGFLVLGSFAFRGLLSMPVTALVGLFACTLMLTSVSAYLTATKISSYRSLRF
ncbi:MAG: glycosyltransferase family 2 protein [Cyanobium sp. CZS 25K]|nr:glycosyltransferase family 2 protein [Cyanobium sp. CZS25K]